MEKYSFRVSILATIVSIAAICLVLFRCEPIKADWMAILVGILALLVALLLGWQIIKTMDFEKKTSRFDMEVEKKINVLTSDLVHLILANEQRINIYQIVAERISLEKSLKILISSIEEAQMTQTPGANRSIIGLIMNDIYRLISDYEGKSQLRLTRIEQQRYCSILRLVEHKDIDNLILYVSKAIIVPEGNN